MSQFRNKGSEWTNLNGGNIEKVRLFWADQSNPLAWPGSFSEVESSPPDDGYLAPGESKVVKFAWLPPDPTLMPGWPVLPSVCLLATIGESILPPEDDFWAFVRNHNAVRRKKGCLHRRFDDRVHGIRRTRESPKISARFPFRCS